MKKRTKYTWVNQLPTKLLELVQANGGQLCADEVRKLKQRERALVVPISLHPLTAKKVQVNASVWENFSTTRAQNQARMGTDSSSESADELLVKSVINELLDLQNSDKKRAREDTTEKTARTRAKFTLPDNFVTMKLLPLIVDVNTALEKIPRDKYTRAQTKAIYHEMCAKNKVLQSCTMQAKFTHENFIKCVGVRFPETASANIKLRLVCKLL